MSYEDRIAFFLAKQYRPMGPFRTAFNGYAVKFSPFEEGRLAVATAQNFGIIGNGRQYVLQVWLNDSCTLCMSSVLMLIQPIR